MLAATFKNMGNPAIVSRFVWIQIDEFLQNFRSRNQMKEEATVNGGEVGDGEVLRRFALDGQNIDWRVRPCRMSQLIFYKGGNTNFTSVFMI